MDRWARTFGVNRSYFFAGEVLKSAAKHSGGTRITMKVARAGAGKQLVLRVLDDGVEGFTARVANVCGTVEKNIAAICASPGLEPSGATSGGCRRRPSTWSTHGPGRLAA